MKIPERLANCSGVIPEGFRSGSASRARSWGTEEQGSRGAGEQGAEERGKNPRSDPPACLPHRYARARATDPPTRPLGELTAAGPAGRQAGV